MFRYEAKPLLEKGEKIDMLTLENWELDFYKGRNVYLWTCRCECGNKIVLAESSLRNPNHFHTCGHYQKQHLIPTTAGDIEKTRRAGKARALKRNKDGVNVDMLFRNTTISSNTSGIQGVSWSKSAHKWHVYVGYKNRRATLGYFEDINDAKKVRELGIEAVKEGRFEEFFRKVRGKEYSETYKECVKKKGQ